MNGDYIKRQRGKPPTSQIDFIYFEFLKPDGHDYMRDYDKAKRALAQYQFNAHGLRSKLKQCQPKR